MREFGVIIGNMAKIDYTVFLNLGIAIALFGLMYYGGQHGWFNSVSNTWYQYPDASSEKLPELEGTHEDLTCTLSVTPTTIFSGESFTTTIKAKINTQCELFISNGSVWKSYTAGKTNPDGELKNTFTILAVGQYKARAICGGEISNLAYLTINPVPQKTCSQKASENNAYYKEPSSSSANCMYIANTECNKVGDIASWTSLQGTCCLYRCIDSPFPPANNTPPAPTCTDADGGINYNVKGDCTTPNSVAHESCIDSIALEERFCNGNTNACDVAIYECPNGCVNGACVTAPVDPNAELNACANHCMDIGYHGATIHVSSPNACWTDTVSTCRMDWGLDAEASTYANGCCCQECVGW